MLFGLEGAAVAVKFLVAHKAEFQEVLENIPTLVEDIKEVIALVEGAKQAADTVEQHHDQAPAEK